MARGLNKVMAIGNLGADPEIRYIPSGAAVTQFNIAVTESWVDKQTGEVNERTEWMSIETWGKLAEVCEEYLSKGSQCFIEGKLQTESWDDKTTGEKKYRTKIRADNVQFLGGKGDAPQRDRKPQQGNRQSQNPDDASKKQEDFDDDIPF